jgi:peroxiredoxin
VGLDVGKRAPEITGQDTDGKDFSLSDYRGKVVLLDFWGHW